MHVLAVTDYPRTMPGPSHIALGNLVASEDVARRLVTRHDLIAPDCILHVSGNWRQRTSVSIMEAFFSSGTLVILNDVHKKHFIFCRISPNTRILWIWSVSHHNTISNTCWDIIYPDVKHRGTFHHDFENKKRFWCACSSNFHVGFHEIDVMVPSVVNNNTRAWNAICLGNVQFARQKSPWTKNTM